jgi:hypothetical protein
MDLSRKMPRGEAVLMAVDGLELIQHVDGTRELRFPDRPIHNLEDAFDAIVAWVWLTEPLGTRG